MATNSSNPDFRLSNSNSGSFPLTSQRTFLGSSISKFSVTAGFGDTTSSLGIDLVDDLRNSADNTALGIGQDVYHGPNGDQFSPPPVGSPVFFSFGKGYPTVSQSFAKAYDDVYGTQTTSPETVGYDDFAFGGILQTYNQTRSSGGDPLYSVQVKDPREVLANTEIILRNYAGSTFDTPNMFNVYGFLEYNASSAFRTMMGGSTLDILQRTDFGNGNIVYNGTDMYYGIGASSDGITYPESLGWLNSPDFDGTPDLFPITGTGMSRIGPQGIPYYRIIQSLNAMMGWNSRLPSEYVNAGFSTVINFRGFNYVVDFSGVPLINQFYYFDYDRISLLDFLLEICEITSHELFISLLPIIDHPKVAGYYGYNQSQGAKPDDMIFGVIRVDTIDKKAAQVPGRIKQYVDSNYDAGIVTQTDIGVELSNVVTDKFIAGGQETDMHFFTTADDRTEESQQSWSLGTALVQQALPYYGRLKSGAVSIAKGHGAYQQILLDASELYAEGVNEYYIATEMELRAADISFERWSEFLMSYNSVYLESLEDDDTEDTALLQGTIAGPGDDPVTISAQYGVTVPRCLWANPNTAYGVDDDLPEDVCFPPYGYPLYYRRGERIGLNGAGFGDVNASYIRMINRFAEIKNSNPDKIATTIKNIWQSIEDANQSYNGKRTKAEKEFIEYIKLKLLQIETGQDIDKDAIVAFITKISSGLDTSIALGKQKSQYLLKNAKKVYAFVAKIAKENLGKKFLVKIPRDVNPYYQSIATREDNGIIYGPYGFRPYPLNNDPRVLNTTAFQNDVKRQRQLGDGQSSIKSMLSFNYGLTLDGRYSNNLVVNYNPITNAFVANYATSPQGGWMPFELFQQGDNNAITQGLYPVDGQCVTNKSTRRTECYVRYDNSQELSFGTMSRNLFTQQVVNGTQFVPDVNYQLDNVNPSKPDSISPDNPAESGPKSVAFVKAQVDAELYFAPQMSVVSVDVHGRSTKKTQQDSLPKKINDCGELKDSFIVRKDIFTPTSQLDGYKSNVEVIIDGSPSNLALLDTDNVYALVTLPARIRPEVDSQLRDGALQAYNAEEIKHYMAMDVVKGVDGFDVPGFRDTPKTMPDRQDLEPLPLDIKQAVRQTRASLAFALPNQIKYSSPSPVYPDLFVLPLQSQEKTYGPWSSSTIGTNVNIGGDVEYSQDENLAPWNYGGYELMNQAGLLKAEFSNSMLLASERGAFTVPDYPKGIYLGKFLTQGGPLVTNINVTVGQGGVTTGYTMDLYTASFGKLQKQKEKAIAKIDRERQKAQDERNNNLRKGISKAQTDTRAADAVNFLRDQTLSEIMAQGDDPSWSSPGITSPPTTTVVSAVPNPTKESIVPDGESLSDAGEPVTDPGFDITGAALPQSAIGETNDKFDDPSQAGQSAYLSASSDTVDDSTGYTEAPRHKIFPARPVVSSDILRQVYGDGFDEDIQKG